MLVLIHRLLQEAFHNLINHEAFHGGESGVGASHWREGGGGKEEGGVRGETSVSARRSWRLTWCKAAVFGMGEALTVVVRKVT
jgi:hypothetical protein